MKVSLKGKYRCIGFPAWYGAVFARMISDPVIIKHVSLKVMNLASFCFMM